MNLQAMHAPRILLIGKPNSGKSLLFNRLTGLNQKVANFPGVTVEVKRGEVGEFEVVDLPGLYSLHTISTDEKVAAEQFHEALVEHGRNIVICVLDSTRLERSLVLGLEVRRAARAAGLPCIFALNMSDELRELGLSIDVEGLAKELDHDVVSISARTKENLPQLKEKLKSVLASHAWESEVPHFPEEDFDIPSRAKVLAQKFAPSSDKILERQTKIDKFFLHELLGLFVFLVVMAFLFQAVFTWSTPMMDGIDAFFAYLGEKSAEALPAGVVASFVKDGLIAGLGSILVFAPQIFFLTFLIGILEDSGYLARAAMICHRPLAYFGLSGKSFIPLLSGHACAIPAIMIARTIESPRARWLTWMSIPLMSCSARLPVYGLLITAMIPETTYLGGLIGLQGLTLLALYLFGILSGLVVAGLMDRFTSKKKIGTVPFVLELPPYRLPVWKPLVLRAFNAAKAFIKRAGSTIFFVSIVIWVLGYFPSGEGHLDSSFLAMIGKTLNPIFEPMGFDWKITVALITSFLAREVFVGTLGILLGMENLGENLSESTARLTEAGITLPSALALLVFFVISLQCVSTLAVLRKESGSNRMPILMLLSYGLAAYVLALATFWFSSVILA